MSTHKPNFADLLDDLDRLESESQSRRAQLREQAERRTVEEEASVANATSDLAPEAARGPHDELLQLGYAAHLVERVVRDAGKWFLGRRGGVSSPMDRAELDAEVKKRDLSPQSIVWNPELLRWQPIAEWMMGESNPPSLTTDSTESIPAAATSDRTDEDSIPEVDVPSTRSDSQVGTDLFCANCGSRFREGAKFCTRCGTERC